MTKSTMLPTIAAVMTTSLLVGCTTSGEVSKTISSPPPSEATPPADYRRIVAEHMRKALFDPYSVRDAEIAPPTKYGGLLVVGTMLHETGWAVCVQANAKNRMGAYSGRKATAYLVRGGEVTHSGDFDSHKFPARELCEGARYEPFPEIEEKAVRR
jgi:hypothetical protein